MHIGFCGTGFMGTPMVLRLLAAGHTVTVWNRTPGKSHKLVTAGAILADSPASLAATSQVIFLCLLDGPAVEAVVFGPQGISQVQGPRWLIDHSSISPVCTRRFAQQLAKANGTVWLDAPVSGGVPGAEAGCLTIMVGGPIEAVTHVEPILRAYASRVTHMGTSGAGQLTKLCNQIIVATSVLAVAEAICLAENNGIAADRLPEALSGGLADSKVLQIFTPRMTQPNQPKTGALATMLKDIDTVATLGRSTATALPLTTIVQNLMKQGLMEGCVDMDLWEIITIYRALGQQLSQSSQGNNKLNIETK